MGNGDGTFQVPVDTYAALALTDVAVADVNGDNQADVLVLDPSAGLIVFLSKGDGTFAAPVSYLIPANSPIFVGDFNGDGKPDILATGLIVFPCCLETEMGHSKLQKPPVRQGLREWSPLEI